ncbi:MAG: TetR/AcrR family transcriptional regulator [Flavipsychrobacter sp.]|nr:TetR/AcrR family transcriptional regulator [Flavipsychrobacter sp.]
MTKAERTRQMIIEQAAPIFNEKGIAGTSIDDVLKAAHVAKGCLYGHFDSKEALSLATVDYMLLKMGDATAFSMQHHTTAKSKLLAFMDLYKDPLNSIFRGGCPIMNFSTEADDTNPCIQQKMQSFIGDATEQFIAIVKEGIANGEFSTTLNAEGFATKMFAAIEGGNMICRVMKSSQPMQTIIKSLKEELNTYCTLK